MSKQLKMNTFFTTKPKPQSNSTSSNPDQENIVRPCTSSSVVISRVDKSALIRANKNADEVIPPKRRLIVKEGDEIVKYVLPDGIEFVGLRNGDIMNVDDLIISESQSQEEESSTFKPPVGILGSVFHAIKGHLDYGNNGEKDENMDSSSGFLALMRSLPSDGTSTLRSKLKSTPIKHNGNDVIIKWQDGILWFNEQKSSKRSRWQQVRKKCKQCWLQTVDFKSGLCPTHTPKPREFLLIRDTNNKDELVLSMIHPPIRSSKFDDAFLKEYLAATSREKSLQKYISSRPKDNPANFTIDKTWSYVDSTPEYQTKSISLAILVFLHNMTLKNESEKIFLKNKLIHFQQVDWRKVLMLLELNGVDFVVGEKDERVDMKMSPLLPGQFSRVLPHTYHGWNEEGGCYDGLVVATRSRFGVNGSGSHKLTNTGMAGVKDEDIVNVFQLIREDSDDEDDEDSEMKKCAKHAEFMGFLATLIARMKGVERDGHVIYPLTQVLPHFNQVFDFNVLLEIFKFKTQRTLEIKQTKSLKIVKGKLNVVW